MNSMIATVTLVVMASFYALCVWFIFRRAERENCACGRTEEHTGFCYKFPLSSRE
jgi:hypothetical protein